MFHALIGLPRRRGPAILIGLLLAGTSLPPAYAIDRVIAEKRHFFECLGLLFRSPESHAANCAPNRMEGPDGSIYPTSGGPVAAPPAAAPPAAAPPVVAPPPPPPAPPACNCGPCYAI